MVVEAGLLGGAAGAGLSLSSGCNFSSSRTREIRDLSIIDNSSDGSIHYKLEVKNLPELVNTQPPAISRATFVSIPVGSGVWRTLWSPTPPPVTV